MILITKEELISLKDYYNEFKGFIFPKHTKIITDDMEKYYNSKEVVNNIMRIKLKYNSKFFAKNLTPETKNDLYFYGAIYLLELWKIHKEFSQFAYMKSEISFLCKHGDYTIRFQVHTNPDTSKKSITIDYDYMRSVIFDSVHITNGNCREFLINDCEYGRNNRSRAVWELDKYKYIQRYFELTRDLLVYFRDTTIPKLSEQWKDDLESYF